jgi:ABC-2 type transport system ATP-binding protein
VPDTLEFENQVDKSYIIKDLTFSYGKTSKLFDHLNLELRPGNIYGLLGKNGVGKTTMLKLMAGLLQAQGGEGSFMGMNPGKRNARFLSELFFVPEDLYVPTMRIKEYIRLFSGFYPRFDREAMARHLAEFELPGDAKLAVLSYGQRKKFMIAFGLAANTGLLVLDEPTNGLDIPSKSQFRKLLASSQNEDRIIVVSTHQVRDMESLIDPIILLDAGRIIFHRSVADISRCLNVGIQAAEPKGDDLLYCEKIPGGYSAMTRNRTGEDSRVDLEVLFNAVVADPAKIAAAFDRGAGSAE